MNVTSRLLAAAVSRRTAWSKLATAVSLIALASLAVTVPAWAAVIDPVAVTLTSPAAVVATRSALIDETWGRTTLPATVPTVTTIANPFGSTLPDVGTVYDYHAAMSNGQVNDSDLYLNSHSNGRVVIMNMGHQGTTSWPSFNSVYNTVPMMDALLTHGFSIYAMNMPAGGSVAAHNALFLKYGNAAMQYFLEPAVQAMNYWQDHGTFSQDDFVGLSGGGWTGTVLQALDPRVKTAVLDAGSLPGAHFFTPPAPPYPLSELPNQGDAEQNWAPFYSIADYVDLYLMGASGSGREQLQILNIHDSCCFGPSQWNSIYAAANGGRTWYQQVSYYDSLLNGDKIIPNNFSVVEDSTATRHQISNPFAVDLALNTLLSGTSTLLARSTPLAVPEPSTWAMMLIGFAGLGFVGYRRTRMAKPQAA
jgi:hypothetical protein